MVKAGYAVCREERGKLGACLCKRRVYIFRVYSKKLSEVIRITQNTLRDPLFIVLFSFCSRSRRSCVCVGRIACEWKRKEECIADGSCEFPKSLSKSPIIIKHHFYGFHSTHDVCGFCPLSNILEETPHQGMVNRFLSIYYFLSYFF